MSIASAPLIGHCVAVARDQLRRVDDVDRQEGDLFVAVEPLVEVRRAHRERRDGHAVEEPLLVAHLARLVELHQAVGEHLRVDAVVAAVTLGEQAGDRRGDRADPRLKRRSVVEVGAGVLGDRALGLGWLGGGQRERLLVALDEQVDLVEMQSVAVVGQEPAGARVGLRDLDDQEAVGVGARARELADRGPGVKREAAPALGIGPRRHRRHHVRRLGGEDRREAAEVGRREADVRAAVAQRPLDRPEEAREVVHVRVLEDLAEHREQRAVDAQVDPVVTARERLHKGRRLPRAERDAQRVGGADAGYGLVGAEGRWHGVTLTRQ